MSEVGSVDGAPPPSIEVYYQSLHAKCSEILAQSFAFDSAGQHQISHNFISDLETWVTVLQRRPEAEILKASLREYQFALLSLVHGQYRHAFMALRLFLELGLGTVYLSANELQLRVWLRGQRDLYWQPLINNEDGVFSKVFVRAFFEGLEDEGASYRGIGEGLYRECSEYVHGNAATHDALPENLQFVSAVFTDWHEKARSARLVVSFALTARYLFDLDRETRNSMESIVLDQLGHIPAIRNTFTKE